MNTYTVGIQAAGDGDIWQAVAPAEVVTSDDTAEEVAGDVAGHQTVITAGRVVVWHGDLTGPEHSSPRDGDAAAVHHFEEAATGPATRGEVTMGGSDDVEIERLRAELAVAGAQYHAAFAAAKAAHKAYDTAFTAAARACAADQDAAYRAAREAYDTAFAAARMAHARLATRRVELERLLERT